MTAADLTIVGLGLIGGSIAAAARRAGHAPIRAVDPDVAARAYALDAGLADETLSPDEAIAAGWFGPAASRLLVLGTPVQATVAWLDLLAELGYAGVVTDVASTKATVVSAASAAAQRMRDSGCVPYRFVGGHPMAGSERVGVQAARETLFDGAYYVLVTTPDTDIQAYRKVHSFATSLGARVLSLDAASHDEAVAIVSHVPHIAAAALVRLAASRAEGADADLLRLAAGGFKDMTRVAAGSPELWTGICLDNAEALASGLDELATVIGDFAGAVRARDRDAIFGLLLDAAHVRQALPAQWIPATARLVELTVPVTDRPGTVSIVTTAIGKAGANIQDIEIDHRSEDSALLRLILTDEGDFEALADDLRAHGFAPLLRPLDTPED